jgi:hypothetical protein
LGEGMNGKRPVAPEGFTGTGRELAVAGSGAAPSGMDPRRSLIVGLAWCLIGSSNAALVPIISSALVAFGMVMLMRGHGRRGGVVALLASLCASAAGTYLLVSVNDIPSSVLMVICSYAVARCVEKGRLKTGALLLTCVAATAAMLGIDMVSTSLQGTSITEVVTGVVNDVVESSSGTLDLDGTTALLEARDQVVAYWPTIYFACGSGMALCALFGSVAGMRASGAPVARGIISRFDAPLWVAALLALGVAADMLGPSLPAQVGWVAVAGANMVLCARLVLAQQGLSVLQWWLRERRVNPFARMCAILAGVWLEVSFALTSVVGLLDLAVNFRHLGRSRSDLVLWPPEER